jgi:hypothetical protein
VITAIMQPYFFPYIGYFQLMSAVETFVVYDDAQYMKGGWINRNRLLANGKPVWLTCPVSSASLKLPINERHYLITPDTLISIKNKLFRHYGKAPAFDTMYPFLCRLLDYENLNVAAFNSNLLTAMAEKLEIKCNFLLSSNITNHDGMKGQAKVIDICHRVGAKSYINPIGGLKLYDAEAFSQNNIRLQFLTANPVTYEQFGATPLPFLSIIDVLMFNSIEQTKAMLNDYLLIMPEKATAQ